MNEKFLKVDDVMQILGISKSAAYNIIVQMDSVIGEKGGKCLLTIHFVDTSFMIAFLRDANTSKSVIDVYNMLERF